MLRTRSIAGVALLSGALPLLGAGQLSAQGNTSSLRGMVLDEQRLAIPQATLRIEDVNGGLRRSMETKDGSFEFAALQSGEYRLTAEAGGFQPKQVRVRVEVNQRLRLDLTLAAKGLAESVDVLETTPLLHLNDASLGAVVDEQQLAKLPLNGRQFLELALLVPGVHTSHGTQTGSTSALYWRPGQNSAVSISGGRPNSNTYLLDGTTNTDPAFNTYVISLPPDSIREFQIQTGTYTAELGGAGTGQVNVVSRSGTNRIHGSLYEYLRNSAFDARLFTSPEKLPHFSQNQFGATLGGPLRSDRLHYPGELADRRLQRRPADLRSRNRAAQSQLRPGPAGEPDQPALDPPAVPGQPDPRGPDRFRRADRARPVRSPPQPGGQSEQLSRHPRPAPVGRPVQREARPKLLERGRGLCTLQPEQGGRIHAGEPAGLRRPPRQQGPEPHPHLYQPGELPLRERAARRVPEDAAPPPR